MKVKHWLGVAGVLYFVATGINEFLTNDIAMLDSLPDAGLLVGAQAGTPSYAGGAIDLAVAGAIYFFVLHKDLIG